jgi:hypothetical protein
MLQNVFLPNLGRAGTAYARSVAPEMILPPTLPDAGLLFDSMFPFCARSSSLMTITAYE